MAQTTLPGDVLMAQPLSAQDQSMVRKYVADAIDAIHSPDADVAQAGRDRLVAPVAKPTSVGFRLYYSEQTLPKLDAMLKPDADPQRAQLALAVAGAVATDDSLTQLLASLNDPRAAVRFGAGRELGALLGQVDNGRAAIQPDRLDQAISQIGAVLSTEGDILVASELARALATPVKDVSLQEKALTTMCQAMADQASTRRAAAANSSDAFTEVVVILGAIGDAHQRLIQRQIHGVSSRPLNDAADRLALESKQFADLVRTNPTLDQDGRKLVDRLGSAANNLHQLATGLDN